MISIIPKFFRGLNAKLIRVDNIVVEKLLKIFLALSVVVYRRSKKSNVSDVCVIDNFDGNIRMKIDRSRSMGAALYWTGFHEFREFAFLHRYLKSNMVFVDIGANQGEYALFAAKRLIYGTVLAFEPLPSIREVFIENISLNGFKNIQVFDFGLSDKPGTLMIHEIEDTHEGLATLYLGERKSKQSFAVQLQSFDKILETTHLTRLDFIKLDIEGGELKALQGSIGAISKFKPVIMVEINEQTYRAAGYSKGEVSAFFEKLGYKAYEIRKRGELIACQQLPDFGNIIFKAS